MTFAEALQEVEYTTDALGQPIDDGIKRLVAALHVQGIPTTASCEGHLDRGEPYPWVVVGADAGIPAYKDTVDDETVMHVGRQLEAIRRQYDDLELYTTAYRTNTDIRYGITITAEGMQLRPLDGDSDEAAVQQSNYATAAKLTGLLADFYRSHTPDSYAEILMLKPEGSLGDVTLLCGGSAANYATKNSAKQQALAGFVAEMSAFADFLVKRSE